MIVAECPLRDVVAASGRQWYILSSFETASRIGRHAQRRREEEGGQIIVFSHTEILELKGKLEADEFVDVLGKRYLRGGESVKVCVCVCVCARACWCSQH